MRVRIHWVLAFTWLAVAGPVRADVWDIQEDNDDTINTDNELTHGTVQVHDLGVRPGPVADQDWYVVPQKPHASYEIVIDSVSGDIGNSGWTFDRIALDGVSVLQSGVALVAGSHGYNRALRWANAASTVVPRQWVRVANPGCSTFCAARDEYTVRVRETTVNVPRFNASGTQTTVLLAQNASDRGCGASVFFWSAAGALLHTRVIDLTAPKALSVLNVAGIPAVAGQSGHVTVAHDCGYGGLVVKAVALEPATGFSFDTPGVVFP